MPLSSESSALVLQYLPCNLECLKSRGYLSSPLVRVGTTVGILGLGFVMDFQKVKSYRSFMYMSSLFIVGLCTDINPYTKSYIGFVCVQFVRAAFGGSFMSQRATIVSDIIGKGMVANAFGIKWLIID